jgi:hypothetical protein
VVERYQEILMKQVIIGILVFVVGLGLARADKIVEDGLHAAKQGNVNEAMNIWLNESLLLRAGTITELVQQFKGINKLCGQLNDWYLLSSKSLGPRTTINQYVLHFEKCPIFGKFTVYNQERLDVITQLKFNANLNDSLD